MVCFVTPYSLSNRHGSGAYLLRVLSNFPEYTHFYWSNHFDHSEVARSYYLGPKWPRRWKWDAGRGFVGRLEERIMGAWWQGGSLDTARLQRLLQQIGGRAGVAYTTVMRTTEAAPALEILRALGCPYVTHLVDLDSPAGLDPTNRVWRELLGGSRSVQCLNEEILAQARKFPLRKVAILNPLARDLETPLAVPPTPGGPLRLVLHGRPSYRHGLELLNGALELLHGGDFRVEVIYIGATSLAAELPEALRSKVRFTGYVSDQERDRILAGCHLAYLPGPSEPRDQDHHSSFSMPSRVVDYLACGLPLIAALTLSTPSATFLAPLAGNGMELIHSSEGLANALLSFAESPEKWSRYHFGSRSFAEQFLSLDRFSQGMVSALRESHP